MLAQSECERLVRQVLTPDLLTPQYRKDWTPAHPTYGHCYAAAEACWYLLGGKDAGWKPMVFNDGTITHWWLQHTSGEICDPTADQYLRWGHDCIPPHDEGRGCGFLTRQPSRRAQVILDRVQALI
jgi:hypothetical protein